VHIVSEKLNLRHLCEPLGEAEAEGMYVKMVKRKRQKGVNSRLKGQRCKNHRKQRLCGRFI